MKRFALSPTIPLALLGVAFAHAASAQAPPPPPDSSDLVSEMRDRQAEFESFRESRIPVSADTGQGRCDVPIGRMCMWFGGEDETAFPPEPAETAVARMDLVGDLAATFDTVKDPWVLGQLVYYLAESGDLRAAARAAERCGLTQSWWCDALFGYALHLDGRYVEAEAAFRRAVAALPAEEKEEERWRTPRYIFTPGAEDRFAEMDSAGRERTWDTFWRLSDPLFLVEGNDRLTEHYARLVVARNQEDAANPYGMMWGDDLEETIVRYGRNIGWSRVISVPGGLAIASDPRSIVGHNDPQSRGYLFPEEFLEAPADIPPESWITTPREARAWYAAPYAPDFRGLDTQVARFRRGDEMLVVAAYQPTPPERDPFADSTAAVPEPRNPFARRSSFGQSEPDAPTPGANLDEGPVEAGFFLVPEWGGDMVSTEGSDREGVFSMTAPQGRYVSSVEVFEPEGKRAWRARQGVSQEPVVRGLVALSDLLILREDAPVPNDLDEAIPLARPGIRVGSNERFIVAWEVYGLGVNQPVQVTLGFTSGRPGFLARVGQFLGVIEPEQPVEISFGDAGGDQVETLFRAIALELPNLDPGEYTLHLRLELPGREPTISSRPIIVTP
jgi:hypothetical protein